MIEVASRGPPSAWFDEQRAYPNTTVDWEAILRARTLVSQRRSALGGLSLSVAGAAAAGTRNTMEPLLDAVRAYATVGEMCDALRAVWGEYVEQAVI